MPQLRDSHTDDVQSGSFLETSNGSFDRIFGIETEYGISVTGTEQPCPAPEVARTMFQPVISRSRSTNTYLQNGARLYLDVGSHPEYATAETRSPLDALKQDLAGERIMIGLAQRAQDQLQRQHGSQARVHLFKNNVDASGQSFGCHENYLLRRQVSLDDVRRLLVPFLVTRQLFAGAGKVTRSGFELSQRADYLDEAVSSATTRSRPMVNTRDEPHANPDLYRRLHVIVGDSNRSQTATWMKLATTHLVLCMIEEAVEQGTLSPCEPYALIDPGKAIRAVSKDVSGQASIDVVGLADSDASMRCSALSIQRAYLEAAQDFVTRHSDDGDVMLDDAGQVLAVWSDALQAIETGDWQSLSSWVDWAAKLSIINAFKRRYVLTHESGSSPSWAQLKMLDFEYHDIINGHVFESMEAHHRMRTLISTSQIADAVTNPPANTRAHLRGRFIQAALAKDIPWSCDWTHLVATGLAETGEERHAEFEIMDPFMSQATPEFEQFIDTIR
ncbi:proteasome accessory factor PafA2 family protein [Bifidobacterium aquikefiricola]|uniref:proteasome accessory factor PafA2 family protein n=1 Tax=Bifidobacterium TaxID=1678 RepID=UPI0038572294